MTSATSTMPTNRTAIGITAVLALATIWQGSATFSSETVLARATHAAATAVLGTVTYTAVHALTRLKSGHLTEFVLEIATHTVDIESRIASFVLSKGENAFRVLKGRIIKPEQA